MGGQDKGWCLYNGKPFIKIVLDKLQHQAQQFLEENIENTVRFVISANRNLSDYRELGVAVVEDERKNFCGPLSGIESVVHHDKARQVDRWLVYPVDSINVPSYYLQMMLQLSPEKTAYLVQGQQAHFVHLSISKIVQETLSMYLDKGNRSIQGWLQSIDASVITDVESNKSILNINTVK